MSQLKKLKQSHLDTTKSFKWLGGLEVCPLRVTGKVTGFTGIDGVETSAGFKLVLSFFAAAASLGGGNSCEVPSTGSLGESGAVNVPSGILRDTGLLLEHTGALLFLRCLLFLLKTSPILSSHIIRPNINLLFYSCLVPSAGLSVGFTRTTSPLFKGDSSLALIL